MKLKYLFGLLLSALFFVGCSDEDNTLGSLGNIVLDKTYVTIPLSGGSETINITASDSWTLSELPEWLTANVTSGAAGETEVTFSAAASEYGREQEIEISIGDYKQFLLVRQGSLDASVATCAEVLAGVDGKTYRIKGAVKNISNETYGNYYINDGTGEVYIYGTLNKDGETKKFSELGIEEGDVVEVEGPKKTYGSTVELVDVTVISITKTLVTLLSSDTTIAQSGGELNVRLAYKGSGVYPEISSECSDWIHYASTEYIAGKEDFSGKDEDTVVVKFNIAENTGDQRTGEIKFNSSNSSNASSVTYTFHQNGVSGTAEKPYTVAEAVKAAQTGTGEVYVKGIVCSVPSISTSYGNAGYYISDDGTETNMLQIYRGYYLNGEKFTAEDQLKQGDEVVLVGKLSVYKEQAQMGQGGYIYTMSSLVNYVLNYGTDGNTYRLKGTVTSIKNDKYGNWYLKDDTGEVYIYGTLDADGNTANFTSLDIEEGDIVEVEGPKKTYNGTVELVNVTVLSITKK